MRRNRVVSAKDLDAFDEALLAMVRICRASRTMGVARGAFEKFDEKLQSVLQPPFILYSVNHTKASTLASKPSSMLGTCQLSVADGIETSKQITLI